MFFEINRTGCAVFAGMVQIRYDCFLEPGDFGFDMHYVDVPILDGAKYEGPTDDHGMPKGEKDFEKWLKGLPTKKSHNPFCCHFKLFPPEATEDEIVEAGKEILTMAYNNFVANRLQDNVDAPVSFRTAHHETAQERVDQIKTADLSQKILAVLKKREVFRGSN